MDILTQCQNEGRILSLGPFGKNRLLVDMEDLVYFHCNALEVDEVSNMVTMEVDIVADMDVGQHRGGQGGRHGDG